MSTGANQNKPLPKQFINIMKDLQLIHGQYSPAHTLAMIIGGIIVAEVIAMSIVYRFRGLPYTSQVLLDAAITMAIIFPLLYLFSFRPLLQNIQQRNKSENILQARLRLIQYANTHNLDQLLQYTLDEIEALTGSTIGFFHFLEVDQKALRLQSWSTHTLQYMCKADVKDRHYDVEKAGVWADAIRNRQAVIHNNFASLTHRKGMPVGHAFVDREMVIPILRDKKVMAILGVGNKSQDYTANDVEVVTTLADFAWDIIEHKLAENALRQSEEKFRTVADWTYDWEKWLDPHGNILYTSPSCERITGYSPEEFIADSNLLFRIAHPDDRLSYEKHHTIIHDGLASPASIEYRIISREGSEHWIEHFCRPVYGTDNRYLGRRVSNRDITERKLAEKKIDEQNQRELILTKTIQSIQTDIARDLHDTLGQNISFLRMNLEHLSDAQWNDPEFVRIQIQNMTKTANESYELIRSMLTILQPGNSPDTLSLFSHYADHVAERSSTKIDIISHGPPKQLNPNQIRQLFYIFREALSNIEKYANASSVIAEFSWGEHALTLRICDNGRGFDPVALITNDHYGLKFMSDRAELLQGSFSVQSDPGQGTKITVTIPYEFEQSSGS